MRRLRDLEVTDDFSVYRKKSQNRPCKITIVRYLLIATDLLSSIHPVCRLLPTLWQIQGHPEWKIQLKFLSFSCSFVEKIGQILSLHPHLSMSIHLEFHQIKGILNLFFFFEVWRPKPPGFLGTVLPNGGCLPLIIFRSASGLYSFYCCHLTWHPSIQCTTLNSVHCTL